MLAALALRAWRMSPAAAHTRVTTEAARVVSTAISTCYHHEGLGKVCVDSEGEEGSPDYRVYFSNEHGTRLSPWHDIPLHAPGGDNTFFMVNEIPHGTLAKYEINTRDAHNPIRQDMKDGELRYYTYKPVFFNYGALPQTWEDPAVREPAMEDAGGDNDPIDVLEIGSRVAGVGEVMPVKVLGVIPLLDEGEVDYKLVAINVHDALAQGMDNLDDVERLRPGLLADMWAWMRDYKTTDGKPQNRFGSTAPLPRAAALDAIASTHAHWTATRGDATHGEKTGLWWGAMPGAAHTSKGEGA